MKQTRAFFSFRLSLFLVIAILFTPSSMVLAVSGFEGLTGCAFFEKELNEYTRKDTKKHDYKEWCYGKGLLKYKEMLIDSELSDDDLKIYRKEASACAQSRVDFNPVKPSDIDWLVARFLVDQLTKKQDLSDAMRSEMAKGLYRYRYWRDIYARDKRGRYKFFAELGRDIRRAILKNINVPEGKRPHDVCGDDKACNPVADFSDRNMDLRLSIESTDCESLIETDSNLDVLYLYLFDRSEFVSNIDSYQDSNEIKVLLGEERKYVFDQFYNKCKNYRW